MQLLPLLAFSLWTASVVSSASAQPPPASYELAPPIGAGARLRQVEVELDASLREFEALESHPVVVRGRRLFIVGIASLALTLGNALAAGMGSYATGHCSDDPCEPDNVSFRRFTYASLFVAPTLLITGLATLIRGGNLRRSMFAAVRQRYRALRSERRLLLHGY